MKHKKTKYSQKVENHADELQTSIGHIMITNCIHQMQECIIIIIIWYAQVSTK